MMTEEVFQVIARQIEREKLRGGNSLDMRACLEARNIECTAELWNKILDHFDEQGFAVMDTLTGRMVKWDG